MCSGNVGDSLPNANGEHGNLKQAHCVHYSGAGGEGQESRLGETVRSLGKPATYRNIWAQAAPEHPWLFRCYITGTMSLRLRQAQST